MAKSGKSHFMLGGRTERVGLKKGIGPRVGPIQKQLIAEAIRLKLQGWTDQEVLEHLEEKYG